MEQNKQTEDAKNATVVFGFVISGETRVSQSQILSCPVCVLLIYYQVKKAWEAQLTHGKWLLVSYWEGQFKFWQQEIWKEVPLITLLLGGRIHKHLAPSKGGFVAGISDSVHHSLSLSNVWSFPLGFSSLKISFLRSMITFVDHVPFILPNRWLRSKRWYRIRRRSDRIFISAWSFLPHCSLYVNLPHQAILPCATFTQLGVDSAELCRFLWDHFWLGTSAAQCQVLKVKVVASQAPSNQIQMHNCKRQFCAHVKLKNSVLLFHRLKVCKARRGYSHDSNFRWHVWEAYLPRHVQREDRGL